MQDTTGILIILIFLKLLQARQNAMIYWITQDNSPTLTAENNEQKIQQLIVRKA